MQKESTILSFARDEAEHQHATGHHGLARNYRCAHNSLSRYLTSICRPHLTISELTSDFILDYQSWLWGQGISRNTSSCYLRSLHAIFNRAVRLGLATGDPFTLAYTGVAKTRNVPSSPRTSSASSISPLPTDLSAWANLPTTSGSAGTCSSWSLPATSSSSASPAAA